MYSVGSAHLPRNNIPINVPPVAQLRYPTEDNTCVFTQSNPSIVSLQMDLPGRFFHRISLLCTVGLGVHGNGGAVQYVSSQINEGPSSL